MCDQSRTAGGDRRVSPFWLGRRGESAQGFRWVCDVDFSQSTVSARGAQFAQNWVATDKVRPKFEELGILEYETMSDDGDIDWMKLERPLDTGEAQSHEQSMLAAFHDALHSDQVATT